jgi:hypothetical protein
MATLSFEGFGSIDKMSAVGPGFVLGGMDFESR